MSANSTSAAPTSTQARRPVRSKKMP